MRALKYLTDEDLVAIGNEVSGDLSYFVAGWDYPESAQRERQAYEDCCRKAKPLDLEMQRRGLSTTRATLCPLGVQMVNAPNGVG